MKTKKWAFLLVFSVLVLVTMACNFNASTANIKDAKMFRDSEGTDATTTFAQDDTFYCIVELANAPDDTKVKAVWTAVAVAGEDPNKLIDEAEMTTGDGSVTFNLTNNGAWPIGTYKVDLYLNDKLDKTLEFAVQ